MSERLHPGQHPDADQLSAFVEHALPDHERLETLAHLAECSDCRQIVFLAEQAHETETPIPHSLSGRMGWLRNWRYLWPAAAAVTCGLLIFPLLHRRRPVDAPQRPAIALESGSPIPASPAQLPQPIVPVVPPSGKASSKTASSSRPVSAATHPNVGIGSVNGILPTPRSANSPSVFELNSAEVDQQSTASLSANSRAAGGFLGASAPQGGPSQVQRGNLLTARQGQPTTVLQSQNQLFPQQASLPRTSNDSIHGDIQQNASQTVSVASAAPPVVQTDGAVLSASSFSGNAAQAKTAKAPLPSNRPAASTISNGVETLAVDSAGDLFISKDADAGWQRIEPQWTGKALRVTLALPTATTQPARRTSQSADTRSSKRVEAVTPTTAATRVGFDLVTDSGAVWSSPDGFVWKQR